MKKVLILSFLLFVSLSSLYAKVGAFYAKVAKVEKANDCYFITIAIWNDNATPNDPTDDYQIGSTYHRWCLPRSGDSTINNNSTMINFNEIENEEQNIIEITKTRELNIFPNPSNETINVDFGNIKYDILFIINETGGIVYVEENDFSNIKTFDLKLVSGNYEVIALSDKNGIQGYSKLIITK